MKSEGRKEKETRCHRNKGLLKDWKHNDLFFKGEGEKSPDLLDRVHGPGNNPRTKGFAFYLN